MEIKQYKVSNGIAVQINPYNERLQYGFESFLYDYTNSERTKILKLHGHERIVDTPATIAATVELEYNCHSNGACSNCSGISCCAIFIPNVDYINFDRDAKQHTYATSAPDGVYDADALQLQIQNPMDGTWRDTTDSSQFYATRLVLKQLSPEKCEHESLESITDLKGDNYKVCHHCGKCDKLSPENKQEFGEWISVEQAAYEYVSQFFLTKPAKAFKAY